MRDIKFDNKSRYFMLSLLLLFFSIVLLSVTALGTSLAWFSDTQRLNYQGNAATVNIEVYNGATKIDSHDDIVLTSTHSTPITFTNISNINAYVRVFITCNWASNSADYGSASDYVTLAVNTDNWYIPTGRSTIGGFIYYKGSVAANGTGTITSTITISTLPTNASVVINVWAEAVQANTYGAGAFASTDSDLNIATWLV